MLHRTAIRTLAFGALLLGICALPPVGAAQDKTGPNLGEQEVTGRGQLADLDLAYALHDYSRETGDPLAAIAALRIAASVPTEEVDRDKQSEPTGATAVSASTGSSGDAVPHFDAIVETARELAGGNDTFQALVEEALATRGKGAVGRPKYAVDTVKGSTRDIYEVQFVGREKAEVLLDGGGDGRLSLFVFDENGNEICSSTRYGDRQSCTWYPRWTGAFRIVVHNHDATDNRYAVVTN